jgi:hypothetical protein
MGDYWADTSDVFALHANIARRQDSACLDIQHPRGVKQDRR